MARAALGLVCSVLFVTVTSAAAQTSSPATIKIGQTIAYSGPASAFGAFGNGFQAFFKMVNDRGGIAGKPVELVSEDDAYSPPKALEVTRRLVESEDVLLMFGSVGSGTNAAVQKYLNARKVPQLFVTSGDSKFSQPNTSPYTIAFPPNYYSEGKVYARYILREVPGARIGVLYQNDDLGTELLGGLKAGLVDAKRDILVATASYQVSDPTIESQISVLKNSGANVLIFAATPKFAAQAIRATASMGWHPLQIVSQPAASIQQTFRPAGIEAATGVLSALFLKDPSDPQWDQYADMKAYKAFAERYLPKADYSDTFYLVSYASSSLLVQVLNRCADDLSRDAVMKQATHLKDIELPMLLPGIKISTSPADYAPIQQMQLGRFDGTRWQLIGSIISGQ